MTKAKKEKKQLLRVEGLSSEATFAKTAVNDAPYFAYVSSPAHGRKQCHHFVSCRDYMNDIAAKALGLSEKDTGSELTPLWEDENPPLDFNKLRLLIQIGNPPTAKQSVDDYKRALFSAKRVINLLEDTAEWSSSTITTIVHPHYQNVWLLTGPAEWMSHPTLFSLVTLVIRFVSTNGGVKTFKNYDDLVKIFEVIIEKKGNDHSLFSKVYQKLPVIMENYGKLFTKEVVEAYKNTNGSFYHGAAGIVSLCEYRSIDSELNEALKKLC